MPISWFGTTATGCSPRRHSNQDRTTRSCISFLGGTRARCKHAKRQSTPGPGGRLGCLRYQPEIWSNSSRKVAILGRPLAEGDESESAEENMFVEKLHRSWSACSTAICTTPENPSAARLYSIRLRKAASHHHIHSRPYHATTYITQQRSQTSPREELQVGNGVCVFMYCSLRSLLWFLIWYSTSIQPPRTPLHPAAESTKCSPKRSSSKLQEWRPVGRTEEMLFAFILRSVWHKQIA